MASKPKNLSVVPDSTPPIPLTGAQKAVFEYLRDNAQAATQEAERRNGEVMTFLQRAAAELQVDAGRYLFNADDAVFEPKPRPEEPVAPDQE